MSMRKVNIKTNVLGVTIFGFLAFVALVAITQTSMYYGLWRDSGNVINKKNTKIEKLEKELRYFTKDSNSKKSFKLDVYENLSTRFSSMLDVVYNTSNKHGINPYITAAIIKAESSFDPYAKSYWKSGAVCASGIMQINLSAWQEELDIDRSKIFNINYNVDIGVRIFKYYLGRANGNVPRALFMYNNGESGRYNNQKYHKKVLRFVNTFYDEETITPDNVDINNLN